MRPWWQPGLPEGVERLNMDRCHGKVSSRAILEVLGTLLTETSTWLDVETGALRVVSGARSRGHIDKPILAYTGCCVQTSYVKHSFYLGFNRGVFAEWFWKFLGHIYLDAIWTMKRRRLSAAETADFSTISPRSD